MSTERSLPTTMTEEVSGWWPSERSAKSRFKALLSRTKLERLTRQHKVEATAGRPNLLQSVHPRRGASAPLTAYTKERTSDTIYSSPTLQISQQLERQVRPLKTQKSLASICQTCPRPHAEQSVYDEPVPPTPLPSTAYRKTSRNVSRSTTDSSVHTLNSVDRLTEPSISDDRSIYTPHTSFSSCVSSHSYAARPFFADADSYEVPVPGDLRTAISTPTPNDSRVLCTYMPTPKKNTRHLSSMTTALDPVPGANTHDLFVQKPLPPLPAPQSQHGGNDRRISTIAPLPEPGDIRKTSARYRCEPPQDATTTSRSATPTSPSSRPSSSRSKSSSCTQDLVVDGGRRRAASYSLFPRTPSTAQQRPPSNSSIPSPRQSTIATTLALQNQCSLRFPRTPSTGGTEDLTRPRPPPLPPSRDPRRHGKVLSTDTAVAAAAVITTGQPPASYISSAEDEGNPRPPLRLAKTSPCQPVLQRQKSMPCLLRPRTPSSGPPPTDPLLALPTVASRCLPPPTKIPPRKMNS
ncbi:uncharacterized protein Z519_06080 [Cladophialophora bantiana CBS 173.52]|uniref:Uncharacterized protein n=1 Tax=Cladophialophora bantiana (strain ATCC 10958 / CBS 173.52 / CDC B-1940 / NIH 8579) TaxID=1442370 RepID=A0A0D2HRL4_CLAB1|nr:uncharacterized protein Z519_06080 [Cladophialophora bantiana CBS 173.52]KIW93475.1 hypothetical protein Z519_06080 [Cladophialophora bantiana CBS 173.52]